MVTAESVKQGIAAGLACEHLEVAGDGEQFQALGGSPGVEGRNRGQRHQPGDRALGGRGSAGNQGLSVRPPPPTEWRGRWEG